MSCVKEVCIKFFYNFKHFASIVTIFSIIGLCLIFLTLAVTIHKPNSLENKVTLLIKPGYSTIEISEILKNNNVIINKWLFIIYVKTIAKNKKLIAGEYEFSPSQSLKEVIKIIAKGESIVRKITIPEGYTTKQILRLLSNEPRLVGAITSVPEEGALFPDTYYFKYGDLRSKIISAMMEKMNSYINSLLYKIPEEGIINNVQKLITLASIIEKEAGNDTEKQIIASVFLNRLKKNMKLQADPTVIYAITRGEDSLGRQLSRKDLEFKSPYNTYVNAGLPPAPIACPGMKSIEAVLNPTKTNYLYFVVDGKGGHNFSSSLDMHNNFVRQYRNLKNKQSKIYCITKAYYLFLCKL